MSARQRFTRRLAEGLEHRQQKHLERVLALPRGRDFTSNDYLGLAQAQASETAAKKPLTMRLGSSASRLLRGHHEIHAQTEARLATFCGTEATLLFTSGFSLNAGIYAALMGPEDVVFSDALNHASIIDGLRLSKAQRKVFPHQDLTHLEVLLRENDASGQAFVVTESLFSMDGDITDLRALVDLCDRYEALLIVDEAHATGLYGKRGSGQVEEQGVRERVLLTIHTAGKALATQGAWVASDRIVAHHLINHCRSFIYSTAMSPFLSAALLEAVDVVQSSPELRKRAADHADYFRTQANARALPIAEKATGPIVPILLGNAERALNIANTLQVAGFDVRAVRPPTVPEGTSRLRVVIHAVHTLETLDELVSQIERALKENP